MQDLDHELDLAQISGGADFVPFGCGIPFIPCGFITAEDDWEARVSFTLALT